MLFSCESDEKSLNSRAGRDFRVIQSNSSLTGETHKACVSSELSACWGYRACVRGSGETHISTFHAGRSSSTYGMWLCGVAAPWICKTAMVPDSWATAVPQWSPILHLFMVFVEVRIWEHVLIFKWSDAMALVVLEAFLGDLVLWDVLVFLQNAFVSTFTSMFYKQVLCWGPILGKRTMMGAVGVTWNEHKPWT